MEEMEKIVKPGHNQSSTDLTTLVLHKVNRSPFAYLIIVEPKLKDFVPPTFRLFKGNFDPVEHIFQFQ